MIGIVPYKYGINGQTWAQIPNQLQTAIDANIKFDAIFIFAGTNDFNANTPLGDWYAVSQESVSKNGVMTQLSKRNPLETTGTFRGRINLALKKAKDNFPDAQIILMTPLHRGYAKFSDTNDQPDEKYSNTNGNFISDFVNVVKEAGDVWSCPVIDLFSFSGMLPSRASYDSYVHLTDTDRLHPGTKGHHRLAQVIAGQLNVIPPILVS